MMNKEKKNVFIIGSKSIGQYGGYETFVDKLTEYHQFNDDIKYHVVCKMNGTGSMDETKLKGVKDEAKDDKGNVVEFTYHNARVIKIRVPNLGSADAIYYDVIALKTFIKYCRDNKIKKPIFYVLASRIGPFIGYLKRQIKKIGGYYCLNPDGHEWKRSKWSLPVQKYWKYSEQLMVKHADLVICDSLKIEEYIQEEYKKYNPITTYISYGSEIKKSSLKDDDKTYKEWLNKNKIKENNYYLMVGRLVPENNYETIVREFMNTKTKKSLVLITDYNYKYLKHFEGVLHYSKDNRIKFVGTVYDQQLLKKIRENAYANIHGHEVGGTNPSLLEALGSTKLNLLNDVGFNKEVARDAALYWNKENGVLSSLINKVDKLSDTEINEYGKKAKNRIKNSYNWDLIANRYIEEFDKLLEGKLRIVMFGHKRIPSREGGVEVVVDQLSTRIVEKGHNVTCFNRSESFFSSSKPNNYRGIRIVNLPTIDKRGFAAATSSIFASIRSAFGKYDIVHIHAEGPAMLCWLPKMFGKKIIVTVHGLDHLRAKWGRLAATYIMMGEKNAVKYADGIIVLSDGVKNYFKDVYNRETRFIPNGVTKPQIVKADLIKQKWDLKKNSYILFLGRLVPEKGLRYLIEAFKNIDTDKKLVIAGGSSDTDMFVKELKETAGDNVIFTDFVEGQELDELYSNAYVYVLPSDLEGMALSLLEALSYGNCCLTSDISECTEVIEDKGITFKKGDVKDLTDKLQYLIDNKDVVKKYKKDASKFVCDKYNWNDVVDETLSLYREQL